MIDNIINKLFAESEKENNPVICAYIKDNEVTVCINGNVHDAFNMLVELMKQYPDLVDIAQNAINYTLEQKARLN